MKLSLKRAPTPWLTGLVITLGAAIALPALATTALPAVETLQAPAKPHDL